MKKMLNAIAAITTANFLRQTAMIDFYNKKYSIRMAFPRPVRPRPRP